MSALLFFEKPGCTTNSRQKRLLTAAGIAFEARSLLSEPWSAEVLLRFFADLPVASWFNPVAPRVKSGEVRPDHLDAMLALSLMVADPMLIRRPLLQYGDWHGVGFDWDYIAARFGIDAQQAQLLAQRSEGRLEGCSHGEASDIGSCPQPGVEAVA